MVTSNLIKVIDQSPGSGTAVLTLMVNPTVGDPISYFTFSGNLADGIGTPISNEAIALVDQGGVVQGTSMTDALGNFSVSRSGFTAGTYQIHALATALNVSSPTVTITVGTNTLTASQDLGIIIGPEPPGVSPQYIVEVGVAVYGGTTPYSATITWSDGYQQGPSNTPVFQRPWDSYPASTSGTIHVQSADGQTFTVSVVAPFTG